MQATSIYIKQPVTSLSTIRGVLYDQYEVSGGVKVLAVFSFFSFFQGLPSRLDPVTKVDAVTSAATMGPVYCHKCCLFNHHVTPLSCWQTPKLPMLSQHRSAAAGHANTAMA
jgi:hypothetical protein